MRSATGGVKFQSQGALNDVLARYHRFANPLQAYLRRQYRQAHGVHLGPNTPASQIAWARAHGALGDGQSDQLGVPYAPGQSPPAASGPGVAAPAGVAMSSPFVDAMRNGPGPGGSPTPGLPIIDPATGAPQVGSVQAMGAPPAYAGPLAAALQRGFGTRRQPQYVRPF